MTEKKLPASIRNNNPGAMWPGPSATKFGSKAREQLKDAQRNQMAAFPSKVQGAAAQFDLLLRAYCGKRLSDAIEMWSGQNSVDAYLAVLKKEVGLKGSAILTKEYISDPATGIPFAKAMAKHEAGVEYPMTDEEWEEAHSLALGDLPAIPGHLELFKHWADIGLKEVPDAGSNPEIDEMFLICGHPKGKYRDDTAWCAIAFYAAIALTGGYIVSANDGNTMAKSVLRWGVPVAENDIRPGDARVEDRGSDLRFGHVDMVEWVDYSRGVVGVIGGNVGNAMTRRTKPIKGARGYRRREDAPKPLTVAVKESPSIMMVVRTTFLAACAYVADLMQAVPNVSSEVTTTVGAAKDVSEAVGWSMSSQVLVTLAVIVAATAVCRMAKNRQEDA